jgi:hypothetical protein
VNESRQLQRGRGADRDGTAAAPCSGIAESVSPVSADRRRHSSPGGASSAGKAAAAAAAAAAPYYPALHPTARYHPASCHREVYHSAPPKLAAAHGSLPAQPDSPGAVAASSTRLATVAWRERAGSASSGGPAPGTAPVQGRPITSACRESVRRHLHPGTPKGHPGQRQAPTAGTVDVDGCLHVDVLHMPEARSRPLTGSSVAAAAAATAVVHGSDTEIVATAAAVQPPLRQGTVFVEVV